MLLNCDLGESYGRWRLGCDDEVMPHIDQANIACGFHGGDPLTIMQTLRLAAAHGVSVGAHPSYPDLVGFGRRSMAMSDEELHSSLLYQIAAIDGMATTAGLVVSYVKPHGALYNDMMRSAERREVVMRAVSDFHRPLRLMLQATPESEVHREEAARLALDLHFEAFADRRYGDDGRLQPRGEKGAVLDREQMLTQVRALLSDGRVGTVSGQRLALSADTLCVHGDNPEGVRAIRDIRRLVDRG